MDLRKLDALVAEHVMDLPNVSWDHKIITPCYSYHDQAFMSIPYYSTSIEAAWDVVEKIKDRGSRGFKIEFQEGVWLVGIMSPGDYGEPKLYSHESGESKSAPLAICLAALKAKNIDVSEWEK